MLMNYYFLITTICTLLLIWWVAHRISNPFKCTCGFETRFSQRFKKHVLQTHKWACVLLTQEEVMHAAQTHDLSCSQKRLIPKEIGEGEPCKNMV